MAYLYCIRTKYGREIVFEHANLFTKAQITNFLINFKAKIQAEAAAGTSITKAMAYDKLIDELISRGFSRVIYVAVIQLSGDNMDFLAN